MAVKATRMNNEQFIRHYMAASSAQDAAKRMGCTVNNVYSRRRELKELGVNLPDFPKAERGIKDVAGLQSLVAELSNAKTETKSETDEQAPGEKSETETAGATV